MPHFQAQGSKEKKTSVLKHTHAYRLHIDLVSRIGALSRRADIAIQTNPKSSESSCSHSAKIWVFDVQQQNIAKCLFQMHCQLSRSTCNWCWNKHKNSVLKPSQLPADNHSLHRFLSVFTVGHPFLWCGFAGGSLSRWEMILLEAVVLLIKQHRIILIYFVSTE